MRRRMPFKLLAAIFALSLIAAACGDDDDDATTTTEAPDDTTDDTTDDEPAGDPEPGPGFDGETIRLGVVTPQTGAAAVIGNPLTEGNRVFFERLNAEGGIAGRYQVELDVVDSQYQAQTGVQQYNSIKNDVVAFVQILGTAVVNAILPQLASDGIVAGPASLDSFWVPEPNLMALGAPYQIQAINAMDYWFNQEGNDPDESRVCTLIQDDPYGEAGQEGIEFAAEEIGFDITQTATFAPTDTDFSAQVNRLSSAQCDVVFLVGLPNHTGSIMGTAAQLQFTPQWIGQSPTWVSILAASPVADYLQANFLLISEGPEWGDTGNEGMAQMLQDLEEYAPDQGADIYFAFGYAQAWSMAQILEEAVNRGDLSRDGVLAAMESVGTISTGGLLGDYQYGDPADREPPRESRVFRVNPDIEGGLEAVSENFTSDAAQAFEFDF